MPFHFTPETAAAIRRWARLHVDVPVCVIVERDNRTILTRGRLKDISDDGVAVFAGVELRPDTEFCIEFTPAFEGSPLRVWCVVRNRRGYTYGVEFLPRNEREENDLCALKRLLMAAGIECDGSIKDRNH